MDLTKLIEEINALSEDELVDNFELEVSNLDLDKKDLTNELDAKTKISRALDILKAAIEDFKNTTAEEIDLVDDADLTVYFESLDDITRNITDVLAGKTAQENVDPQSEMEQEEANNEEPTDEESDEDFDEPDFDTEAELDLFGDEEDTEPDTEE